jgi:MYXO-CTERM domain-containing protein
MSNGTSPRLHKLFGAVVALGLSAAAAPSAASSTYPEAMAEHLDPPCVPQCTVCHRDNVGGRKTVDKPFGLAMMELGLRFAAPQRIPTLLDQLEAEGVDSDGDGASDVVELRAGQDPNGDEDLCGLGVKYGCFNRVAGGAPSEGAGTAALGLLSLSIALVMRRRRSSRSARDRK